MLRRSGIMCFASILAMTVLLLRIFSLSIGENAGVANQVISQRMNRVVVSRSKGLIYDRNLLPVAGMQPCKYVVVIPRGFDRKNVGRLAECCGESNEKILNKLKKDKIFVFEAETIPTKMEGVLVIDGYKRYSGVAQHLIGYLDEEGVVGLSGIEKEYNDFLSLFSSSNTIRYSYDAVQGAIGGLGIGLEQEPISKNGVVLTLDSLLCEEIDKIIEDEIAAGTVVVMDCKKWELLAVCSSPGYDEKRIREHIESDDGELLNRAFLPQQVGSVFKLVVAACALSEGLDDYRSTCDGGVWVADRLFMCHNHEGHGNVDMKEAMAQSCNSYFISLGQLLGYDKIKEFVQKIEYNSSIPLAKELSAVAGTFPEDGTSASLANLSIGQGKLLASPLHTTIMTALIANGGKRRAVKLIDGLYLNDKIKSTESYDELQVLEPNVAERLKEYCIYSVMNGTGSAATPKIGGAGGKTSSAQTGVIKDGKEKLNVCFSGFYPADDPRYAITVYAEDGISGGKTCAPIFKRICDYLEFKTRT